MSHTIDTLLQSAGVPRYDKGDPTLSSGEHALAAITAVLVEHWDLLPGAAPNDRISDGGSLWH